MKTCEFVQLRYGRDFERILQLRGTKRAWFSRNPNYLLDPVQVGRSGIYAETNMNARSLALTCQHILVHFGMEPNIRIRID